MIDYAALGFVAPEGTADEQLAALAEWKATSPAYKASEEMRGGRIIQSDCICAAALTEIHMSSWRGDPWAVDEGGCRCKR